jgi:2-polyprenyl-3-methyl-5-hydroxy-6-metoxy-1,4-benzoquinol methylase
MPRSPTDRRTVMIGFDQEHETKAMTVPFDWTRLSDDPNNREAMRQARRHLLAQRQIHADRDLLRFVVEAVQGKRVLDIGVVSHAARYFDEPGWRHGRIRAAAQYCVGVDILEPLVNELNTRGFNVRCVDATSEADLDERFDVVFIGDVIEHVDNAVALLRFAGRHLASAGRLLVATPNPFSRKFFRRFQRQGVALVNLDHVSWITPTMALELGRRSGLTLRAYHLIKPMAPLKRVLKRLAWRFTPPDYTFPDYVYEFRSAANSA